MYRRHLQSLNSDIYYEVSNSIFFKSSLVCIQSWTAPNSGNITTKPIIEILMLPI